MSLYEILKAAKIGAAPDVLTKLRAQIAPFAKNSSGEQNLYDKDDDSLIYSLTNLSTTLVWAYGGTGKVIRIPCDASTKYTLTCDVSTTVWRLSLTESDDIPVEDSSVTSVDVVRSKPADGTYTFETTANTKYLLFQMGASVFDEGREVLTLYKA